MAYSIPKKALHFANSLLDRSNHLSLLLKHVYNRIFANIRKVEVFLIKGVVKNAEYSITTLFMGPEESACQLAYLVYSEIERILPLGKFLFCQIDPPHLPDVEIIAVKVRWPFIGKFSKQGYLLLPNVSFSLDLRGSRDQVIKRSSRRRRRSIKKLQSFNYSYTISRDRERDFDFFYWKMYLPYTRKRFGRAAHLNSYLTLKAVYKRNGGIVFVKKEEKRIVGLLFQIRGKTLYAKSLGVYEANQDFVTELAGQAVLFFLIKWAKIKGMESLDYGITMPFFRDGIFTYKKEWGMHIELRDNQPFCALRLNGLNEGTLSFLLQNPFIFLDKGVMKGAVLVNHRPTKLELQQIHSKHFLPGLDSLIVMAYHTRNTGVANKTVSSRSFENFADTLLQPLASVCLSLQKRGFAVEVHAFEHKNGTWKLPFP